VDFEGDICQKTPASRPMSNRAGERGKGTGLSQLLITGGAGFIGEQLTRRLVGRGHFVRVVDQAERADRLSDLPTNSFRFHGADFSTLAEDDPVFSGVDTIIHLASTSVPQTSMVDLETDARHNILSAIRIMKERSRPVSGVSCSASSGAILWR
jgi:UDP-glucose 4-epimerase